MEHLSNRNFGTSMKFTERGQLPSLQEVQFTYRDNNISKVSKEFFKSNPTT